MKLVKPIKDVLVGDTLVQEGGSDVYLAMEKVDEPHRTLLTILVLRCEVEAYVGRVLRTNTNSWFADGAFSVIETSVR